MDSAQLDQLTPEKKRELLRQLMARKQAASQGPLNRQQARLWFFQSVYPHSAAYNMHQVYRIRGPLDSARLERALAEIVQRHESLRTAFQEHLDQPVQVVRPMRPFQLEQRPLEVPPAEREAVLREQLRQETLRPFDLAEGYLFRFPLLRFAADDHALIVVMHHLIADIWSFKLLNNELTALYEALGQGRAAQLAPLPLQAREIAAEEQRAGVPTAAVDYWCDYLQGIEVCELPTDHPRGAVPALRGAVHRFPLNPAAIPRFAALAESARLTLPMAWMALFQLVLHRVLDSRQVSCATPIADRDRAEAHHLIAFMVNTLVLRCDFGGNPDFHEVLRRFYSASRGVYLHPEAPFDQIVRRVLPVHDSGRNPLYEIMFQVGVVPQLSLAGLDVANVLAMEGGAVRSDLEVYVGDQAAEPEVLFNYDSALFERATMVALGERFQRALAWVVDQPEQGIDRLCLLTSDERASVLGAWNQTRAPYGRERCMHELFLAQAERTPEAVAVVCGEQSLSYGELATRVRDLATELRARGAGPERFVGICCPRSLEMVVGVLAIQAAGAAYVPMDAEFPLDRIAYILADVEALLLLTHSDLLPRLIDLELPLLALDSHRLDSHRPAPAAALPHSGVTSANTAYLIFTSGSTGRPKGVIIRHHTVINLIEWVNQTFAVGPAERLLFTTSLCFDLSVYDIFGTLAAGGRVVVARESELREPALLVALIERRAITFWDSAPAALMQLVPFLPPRGEGSPALRLAFLSGDWIPLSLQPALTAVFPNLRVIGLGGATEATIWSNFFPIRAIDPEWKSVPYGRPIQNARYYTLDSKLLQAPLNVPADLYIAGGDCLSYGYFKQPRLTAARYLPDPFADEPGAFLYTTGDRARWQAAGHMEFLGRRDAQVKIRGFRIELGEIEAALAAHERVEEAVALAREDQPGDKRLVVYVQTVDGRDLPLSEIIAFLERSLPAYMLPSARVVLASWPVTVNGKLDRKALPAPGSDSEAGAYVAPRGELEETLCALFAEVLELERVSAAESFFNLGGHSLNAAQTVARLRKTFQLELPIRDLFTYPSAQELAAAIAAKLGRGSRDQTPIPVQAEPCTQLAFAQERLWYFGYLAPGSTVYNLTASIRLSGLLEPELLRAALRLLVARHEPLRTRFPMRDGRPVAVVEPAERFEPGRAHHPGLSPAERDQCALELAQANQDQAFDLEQELPFRASLHLFAADDVLFVCGLHHIITDGWSITVLFRELNHCYNALRQGREVQLAPLPIRYSDYVAWQRSPERGAAMAESEAWWRAQLAGTAPVLALPADRPRPPEFGFHGRDHFFKLTASDLAAVQAACQQAGTTSFMFLLAAVKVLLWRYSGQPDIWIGTSAANRGRLELEPLIGLFFNTVVLRTRLARQLTVADLLARVRQTTFDAQEHEDLSFERLVEALNPERDLSHNPLFQVMFTHMAAEIPTLELEGVRATRVPSENRSAKFDLIFDLAEGAADGGLRGRIEYNLELFERATIQRMEHHLRAIIGAMCADPTAPIARLPMLAEAERHQLLYTWNDTAAPYSEQATLFALFAAAVARTPEAIALVQGDHALSYAELAGWANAIAAALLKRGIGAGQLVPFCLERGPAMIATMLGILQCGAAYVPTDVRYPLERVRYIVAELEAPLFLTQASLAPTFAALESPLLCSDELANLIAPNALPRRPVEAGDLAYLIFTSGSTGKPKGVMLQHRPVVNLIEWVNQTFAVGPGDRLLFTTSPCFDLSVYDIFGILAAGATVQIASEAEVGDALALAALLNEQPITFWDSAPAALLQLVPLFPTQGSDQLRLVFLSGDWIPLSLPGAVTRSFPNARVIGLGGATEAAIWSNFFPIGQLEKHWRSIPYGRPIQNAAYHVLDAELQPCPVNVAGDLYIGARCLSRGYWRQPALTAQRYLPDPYCKVPGSVLYCTGDRARFWSDGTLEFLGRLDAQVKIRGFRIELGEIEAVLAEHPAVREAVVLARADHRGEKQLVAYLLPQGPAPSAGDCAEHLRAALPEYMVPAHFVCLDAWPVTSNGKLDRAALPEPERSGETESFLAPRSEDERLLAAIFAEVLERDRVGVRDNYFELGGDSIQSIRIISLARAQGLTLAPRHFFQGQTVEGILTCAAQAAAPVATAAPVDPGAMSAAQQGLFFVQQLQPQSAQFHIDLGLHVAGPLNLDLLDQALAETSAAHRLLRSGCALVAGEPRWHGISAAPAVTVHDACGQDQAARRAHQLARATVPFDLAAGPLLRLDVWRLAEADHELVLTVHHLISDAVSLRLLLAELARRYAALVAGRPADEPARPQYADYVAWQRGWLASAEAERQRAFWAETLAACPTHTRLPGDSETVNGDAGSIYLAPFSAAAMAHLRDLREQSGATTFTLLLTLYAVVLRARGLGEDLVVGTDVSTRGAAGSEHMQGLFINQLPLRLQLVEASFGALLEQVGLVVRAALAHQELPFDQIVEAAGQRRGRDAAPLFQTKLGFHQMLDLPHFAGQPAQLFEVPRQTTQVDLNLNFLETRDGLHYHIQYSTERYREATIAELARQLDALLGWVAQDLERPLAGLLDQLAADQAARQAEGRQQRLGRLGQTRRIGTGV